MKSSARSLVLSLFASCALSGAVVACGDGATEPSPSSTSAGVGRPVAVACATSDACGVDADCASEGSHAVCGCGLGSAGTNVCLGKSQCRVDGDCGEGRVCGFSRPFLYGTDAGVQSGDELGGFLRDEALGYFCTTPQDECAPAARPTSAAERTPCVFRAGRWVAGSAP